MKNKKGFTLVELLAVIAIMGFIAAIAIPSYTVISNNLKEQTYESKLKIVKSAVEDWAYDNKNNCTSSIQTLTVSQLIADGYLESDSATATGFVDPRDNSSLLDRKVTTLQLDGTNYITANNICSNYH